MPPNLAPKSDAVTQMYEILEELETSSRSELVLLLRQVVDTVNNNKTVYDDRTRRFTTEVKKVLTDERERREKNGKDTTTRIENDLSRLLAKRGFNGPSFMDELKTSFKVILDEQQLELKEDKKKTNTKFYDKDRQIVKTFEKLQEESDGKLLQLLKNLVDSTNVQERMEEHGISDYEEIEM